VKRSGRDELMWTAIHMYMEAMLGISLYSYLYFNLSKHYAFLISYIFSSAKLGNKRMEQILPGSCREGREVHSNNVYTVSKCQNGKILKKENLV
jgi:hypothetical protein